MLSLRSVLTDQDVRRIHGHSLDLLEQVGIRYNTPKALEVLEAHGCPVDYDRNWASLPRDVVERAVTRAPRVVRLQARDPARDVVLDGRRSHHTTSSQAARAIDRDSGEVRPSKAEDLRRGLLFADALDMVDIVNVMVAATDIPAHVRTIRHFAMAFTQTSKHVRTGVLHARQVPFIVELVEAALGGEFRPIFSAVDCTVSPFVHDGPMTEACIELARLEVPIMVYPMPLVGATAPATLAGTVLVHNVELLSGLVLFQLVEPGAPIIYGTGAVQLDMQTGSYRDNAQGRWLSLALLDLARFYHLPVNLGGLGTFSRRLDAQYGFEAASGCLLSYLAGADEIYSIGLLGGSQFLSLEKMVLDNHLARELETMVQPVGADEEHLQAEVIERVGIGGHYLSQPETRAFTKREYVPVWPPAGKDMMELVRAEVEDILSNHRPPSLPEGALARMEDIVNRAAGALS